jgi:hypothetical protein
VSPANSIRQLQAQNEKPAVPLGRWVSSL